MRKRFGRIILTLVACGVAAACASQQSPSEAGVAASSGQELISRDLLFDIPERRSVGISADGSRLSYLALVNGASNLWVADVDEIDKAKPVTDGTTGGISMYSWTYSPRYLVFADDAEGDENWHVYVFDVETAEVRDLTPFEGVQARIVAVSRKRPNEMLVGLNNRNRRFHDVYRVNLETGELTEVEKNEDGYAAYMADADFNLRLALKFTPTGDAEVHRKVQNGWKLELEIGVEDAMTTYPLSFTPDGKKLYLADSRGRDTSALVLWDIAKNELVTLAEDDRSDLEMAIFHPIDMTPQAVSFNYSRRSWKFLDPKVEADFGILADTDSGEIRVLDRTVDDTVWVVAYERDDGPLKYYLYNRIAKKPTFLFTGRPALEKEPLVKMYPTVIEARDGLGLVSYYSLPAAVDDNGRAKQPVPTVLLVHGGPWERDSWGYDARHQWLANRGYAVLSVNFRGSTGFGKKFINAGNMEWAGKMHDDLIDAVRWAIGEGIALPDKVAIQGFSYGGYAALVGLAWTPEQFACGVDIAGPSNLVTLLENLPAYWIPIAPMLTSRMGDYQTEEGRKLLQERSPLFRADKIVRPLLVAQGARDPRVKKSESEQIVEAMKSRGIPVTYVLFEDEGHRFDWSANEKAFRAMTEAFFGKCLGGRVEAYGSDFVDASFSVPEGASHVPGLAEALHGFLSDLASAFEESGDLVEAEKALRRAEELSPQKAWPHVRLASIRRQEGRYEDAELSIGRALELDPQDASAHNGLGQILYDQSLYEMAIPHFRKATELDDEETEFLSDLAWAFEKSGDLVEAEKPLRRAAKLIPEKAWPQWRLAAIRRQEGRYEDAEFLIDRALELEPENAWTYRQLGLIRRDQSRYDEAIIHLRKAAELDPEEDRFWTDLEWIHELAGEYAEAEIALDQALELGPDKWWIHHRMGRVHRLQREYEEAQRSLKRAIELKSDDPSNHFELGRVYDDQALYKQAIPLFRRAAELAADTVVYWQWLGHALEKNGDYAEVEIVLKRALELSPEDPAIHHRMGRVHRLQRQYDKAERSLKRAIELDPQYVWAHEELGLILYDQSLYEMAIPHLRKATELDDQETEFLSRLAWAFEKSGDLAEAEKALRRAAELIPEKAWPQRRLASIRRQEGHYEDAEFLIGRALELEPEDAWTYHELGLIRSDQSRYDEAITHLRRAVELDPKQVWFWVGLEWVHELAGEYAEAEVALDRALELSPEDPGIHHRMGRVSRLQRQYDKAEKSLKRAIDLNPNDASTHFELGRVYDDQALYEQAIPPFRRAAELAADEAGYWQRRGRVLEKHPDYAEAEMALKRMLELATEESPAPRPGGSRRSPSSTSETSRPTRTEPTVPSGGAALP